MPKKKKGGFNFDFSSLSFDFTGPEQGAEEAQELRKLNMLPVAFENAEALADSIDYTKDYFALVSGSFIFGDFIEALCLHKELRPSEIYITTLGMSDENIDSIVNLTDYLGVKKVNLIVSNYFAAMERHKSMQYLQKEFSGRPIDVAVLASHCKIVLIFSEQGDVMLAGSANLSSSNNVEQFIMLHDPDAIRYVRERLDGIMERFTVYHGLDGKADMSRNKNNTGHKAFAAITGKDG